MMACSTALLCALVSSPPAGEPPHAALVPVPIERVRIDDAFWSPKLDLWAEATLRDVFDKLEADGALRNFDLIRDGVAGEHGGPPWYDGLLYETIRGAADFLRARRDPELEARIDAYVARIAAAAERDPNGYINTYTQLTYPERRWGTNGGDDNWQHDLYNAGCLVEAGIHYYRATGKTDLLAAAVKLANTMCATMGPAPKANIVPGHSIGEETVVKLYLLFREQPELENRMPVPVDEDAYLRLAGFWIENRGHTEGRKDLGPYGQDHAPVLEQATAEGHAVRATLLYAGLALAAAVNGREDYRAAAERLWLNMVGRRMYVTGGLGAVAEYEGFGPDYVLPNEGYLETCAAVGAAFFHHRMNLLTGEARYADELERTLYNSILVGTGLDGTSYFYENPLERGPERSRWPWHGCPCCPPMFVKAMGALPGYIYATDDASVYVNLFVGSEAELVVGGIPVTLTTETRYPWAGDVRITVAPAAPGEFEVCVRIPEWAHGARLEVAGGPASATPGPDGYAHIRRRWRAGDTIELHLPMEPRRTVAHHAVAADRGRVALERGPLVYCFEGLDNGGRARSLALPYEETVEADWRGDLLGGVTVLRTRGAVRTGGGLAGALYSTAEADPARTELVAIPYFATANRGATDMVVWIPETIGLAMPCLPPSLADGAAASASHRNPSDTLAALSDRLVPLHSADESCPRFTWWDHRGTDEWVEYDFARPTRVRACEVYWWDETAIQRHCRVPESWRVLYRKGEDWLPVASPSEYGTARDAWNRVEFAPVETDALRIEVRLQPEWSGGILEWRVE